MDYHLVNKDNKIVKITARNNLIAVIYPKISEIKVISKYLDKIEQKADFPTEVSLKLNL